MLDIHFEGELHFLNLKVFNRRLLFCELKNIFPLH